MKKIVTAMLAAILCAAAVLSFTACGANASKVKVIEYQLTSEEYVFAVKTGDTETQTALNAFLKEIDDNGKLNEIVNSFFDGNSDFAYENPSSKNNCLVVATSADFPPFEYKDGNKFTGIDMQIAKLFADKLGKTLYIDDIGFDQVILAMGQATSEYTLGMAGITYSEERDKTMDFSNGYYTSAQVIIVKEGDTSFDNCKSAADVEKVISGKANGYKIGTQKGTTGYMYSKGDADFGYDGFSNVDTKMYDSGALAVKDLSNGKIDAVIIDEQPAKMISKSINAGIK